MQGDQSNAVLGDQTNDCAAAMQCPALAWKVPLTGLMAALASVMPLPQGMVSLPRVTCRQGKCADCCKKKRCMRDKAVQCEAAETKKCETCM